jgi:hypothetical protein
MYRRKEKAIIKSIWKPLILLFAGFFFILSSGTLFLKDLQQDTKRTKKI